MQTLNEAAFATRDEADWLSELMDGEVSGPARAAGIQRLCQDAAARERWGLYHRIGDALRGVPQLSSDFDSVLRARLAQEPTVLAPRLRRLAARAAVGMAVSLALVAGMIWLPGREAADLRLAKRESGKLSMETQLAPYLVAHQEFSPMAVASPYQRAVMIVGEPGK